MEAGWVSVVCCPCYPWLSGRKAARINGARGVLWDGRRDFQPAQPSPPYPLGKGAAGERPWEAGGGGHELPRAGSVPGAVPILLQLGDGIAGLGKAASCWLLFARLFAAAGPSLALPAQEGVGVPGQLWDNLQDPFFLGGRVGWEAAHPGSWHGGSAAPLLPNPPLRTQPLA